VNGAFVDITENKKGSLDEYISRLKKKCISSAIFTWIHAIKIVPRFPEANPAVNSAT
jgi:hypothetical protein